MTAIAWAAVFIALVFYSEIYKDRIESIGHTGTLAGVIIVALGMLVICTVLELFLP